ncbi:MAG TPA: response regulator transcription factor [Anaeromyxobacteraceae bacterium]|jgi:DNA-binding response OmpR family regulator
MAAMRVLLVDDDPEICRFLSMLLEIEGYAPVVAVDADQALSACALDAPQAILVDIAMPDVDGLELCRLLRRRGVACPILVVSARPGHDLARKALEAGADEFVRKPFDNADLLARLRTRLSPPT